MLRSRLGASEDSGTHKLPSASTQEDVDALPVCFIEAFDGDRSRPQTAPNQQWLVQS